MTEANPSGEWRPGRSSQIEPVPCGLGRPGLEGRTEPEFAHKVCVLIRSHTAGWALTLGNFCPRPILDRGPAVHVESNVRAGVTWGGWEPREPRPLSLLLCCREQSPRPKVSAEGFDPRAQSVQLTSTSVWGAPSAWESPHVEKEFSFFCFISSAWLDARDVWPYSRDLCCQEEPFASFPLPTRLLPASPRGGREHRSSCRPSHSRKSATEAGVTEDL